MSVRSLADAIILQSMEDLFSPLHKSGSIHFFTGEGFRISSEIAGLRTAERHVILDLFSIFVKENENWSDLKKKSSEMRIAG